MSCQENECQDGCVCDKDNPSLVSIDVSGAPEEVKVFVETTASMAEDYIKGVSGVKKRATEARKSLMALKKMTTEMRKKVLEDCQKARES